ncbi:MAG: HAD-IC family P-type ATPase [Candidatus Peribacteria bacterium]|jgi:Ca2+-transporting ATPase|nr:HAD-IC family P-type ATPase [Candidatus Peribacteria bacterium]
MITGDNAITAGAIAKELGISGKALNGMEVEQISDKELKEQLDTIGVFARVSPHHKQRIVKLLQEQGNIVAMTGDGVNDAPALKYADIGLAMGITGTEVSKEASDMILMDDNFTTIVNAVEEGRGIYNNIKKFVNFLLATNFAEIIIIFVSILC